MDSDNKLILYVGGPAHGKVEKVPPRQAKGLPMKVHGRLTSVDQWFPEHIYTKMVGFDDLPVELYQHSSLIDPKRRIEEIKELQEKLYHEANQLAYRFGY